MTPEKRWEELAEITNDYTSKGSMRHHFIRSIKEAVAEALGEVEKKRNDRLAKLERLARVLEKLEAASSQDDLIKAREELNEARADLKASAGEP